jgi:hypothetical protein
MQEIKINAAKSLTKPAGATHIMITHEWGDTVLPSTAVGGATYDFTPDSIGVHKIVWTDGTSPVQTTFYAVVQLLISSSEYFAEHSELEDFEDLFPQIERLVRQTVQNYTGQKFGPLMDKSLEIQGDGGDALALPVRAVVLSEVTTTLGDDITDFVEISPNDPGFLQKKSQFRGVNYFDVKKDFWYQKGNLFNEDCVFIIQGNFGWEYVPIEVSDAASLLITDLIGSDDVAEMRSKGVFEVQIGDFSARLNADQWGTTGNTRADNLLAAYTTLGFGLV